MAKDKIGIGFIGAGEISILHAIALREIPNAELIGLWNRTTERAIKRAQQEGCKRYETAEDVVNDPAVDAVIAFDIDNPSHPAPVDQCTRLHHAGVKEMVVHGTDQDLLFLCLTVQRLSLFQDQGHGLFDQDVAARFNSLSG